MWPAGRTNCAPHNHLLSRTRSATSRQDAFFEVLHGQPLDLQEQEQLDALKAFWKTYGNLITWALIAALGCLPG
jgi:hypothetical protein